MSPTLIKGLFDKVVVVSLKRSSERRAYIRKHLPECGFADFEFFEAVEADSQCVKDAYRLGEVSLYPPCFRCGKLDCGNPDCNNFLIPAQVATYLTYRKLWERLVSDLPQRILVVEDDVSFHRHAEDVLGWLKAEIQAERLPFNPDKPCLLRLGWASSDAHNQSDLPYYIDQAVKMSNPCHALTTEFATRLLERDTGINHTVDVFQHKLAPEPGEAYTVYPPIASELSWSKGVFASTIHPKEAHERYLSQSGQKFAAQDARRQRAVHVKKKHFRPILIIGHPRCGTGYAANLCRQMGVDIGHETLGSKGISSWMFAVEADSNPYALDEVAQTRRALAWKYLIYPVRNLYDAVPSVIRNSTLAPASYDFRREHILSHLGVDLNTLDGPVERAVWSVTSWARIGLSQNPDLVFRIEDQHETLRQFLVERELVTSNRMSTPLVTKPVNANKPYKGVRYSKPLISEGIFKTLEAATRAEINWYNERFGYAARPYSADEQDEIQSKHVE